MSPCGPVLPRTLLQDGEPRPGMLPLHGDGSLAAETRGVGGRQLKTYRVDESICER